jgi:hypothetical protein
MASNLHTYTKTGLLCLAIIATEYANPQQEFSTKENKQNLIEVETT